MDLREEAVEHQAWGNRNIFGHGSFIIAHRKTNLAKAAVAADLGLFVRASVRRDSGLVQCVHRSKLSTHSIPSCPPIPVEVVQ